VTPVSGKKGENRARSKECTMIPSYRRLYQSGELQQRAADAIARLGECRICPRNCRIDRLHDQEGFCRTGRLARVSGFDLHFGEEEPLVGTGGSGTIFFMQCNLACEFCQNWEVSHGHACGQRGTPVTAPDLARIMLDLQERGPRISIWSPRATWSPRFSKPWSWPPTRG
jgi:putative pyruvate formate lyase activating enzyme